MAAAAAAFVATKGQTMPPRDAWGPRTARERRPRKQAWRRERPGGGGDEGDGDEGDGDEEDRDDIAYEDKAQRT
eukprot:CAMPEP_0182468914 /NCGR_PEP_ID=MMETSP1319-20130603/16241_1 /TAXON_ID=172717 /ORGANISM="Bolidomonas pacifica, Strain RCC208" /LENGTH=73 /DNA_ID=CAMNT_0024669163 /DNA_START=12 /DNA_END=233 /DNA_ORIENTATION=-